MAQCTARSKTTGERCKRLAVTGSTVCRVHGAGGGAPVKHGRYSKYLPKQLATRYKQMLRERSLLDGTDHLALLETLIVERLEQFEDGRAQLWAHAIEALAGVREAMSGGDAKGVLAGLDDLEAVLRNGQGRLEAESSVRELIQESAKVRQVEIRLEYGQQTALSVKEMAAFLAAVLDAVNTEVSSPEERRRVAEKVVRLAS